MPDKLPINLPVATPGTKIVHAVNTDDPTDTPQGTSQQVQVADVSAVSNNAIPKKVGQEFVDSALVEDAVNLTSSKPIFAPSLNVLPGTVTIGPHALKSGGETFTFTNTIDQVTFEPVWIEQGTGIPLSRTEVGIEQTFPFESSKADILINPIWNVTPTFNQRTVSVTFETDTTITNVIGQVFTGGQLFYQAELGTLAANVETKIELNPTTNNVPVDVFLGSTYEFRLISADGDVRAKGSTINALPFFTLSSFAFVDFPSQTLPDSTGVSDGGDLTFGTTTTIQVSSGIGFVVDATVSPASNVTLVSWVEDLVFAINVATDGIFTISVDVTGTINQDPIANTSGVFGRSNMILGSIRITGNVVARVETRKTSVNETYTQFLDFLGCLGLVRCSGLIHSPSTGLQFSVSSGELISRGLGTSIGSAQQNTLPVPAATPAVFDRALNITGDLPALAVNTLDPGNFDNGSGVPVAIGGSANQATIQYIYKAPVDALGLTVAYGQQVYSTIDDAVLNEGNDVIVVPSRIADNHLLVGRIVCRAGGVDITDENDFVFLEGAKFGSNVLAGGSGGGGGGGDMFGAASSVLNQVVTYADATGKTASNAASMEMTGGLIKRTGAGSITLLAGAGGEVIVTKDNTPAVLKLNTTGVAFSAEINFAKDGVDFGTFRFLEDFNSFFIRDEFTGRGLYVDIDNNRASLFGVSIPTDDIAFEVVSTDGVVVLPSILDATIGGLVYPVGSMWYQVGENAIKGLTADGEVFLAKKVLRTAQLGSVIDFTFPEAIRDFTMGANTTMTHANLVIGNAIQLEVDGNFVLSFGAGFQEMSGSRPYDGAKVNVVYMYVSSTTPDIIDYMITQRN